MRDRSERGVSAVLVAMTLLVIAGAAALAVDIGALWMERSADQKVTDSAAAAGVIEAVTTNGQAGCVAALGYVDANSDEINAVDTTACATDFSASCTSGEFSTVTSGRFTITVTYPVADSDPLMSSGQVGAGTQSIVPADGSPCERLGVQITATRDSIFGAVIGSSQLETSVHTVAAADLGGEGTPINLLVLDRTGCQTIWVQGEGGIIVDAVIAEDDMGNPTGLVEGLAASDSDGSAGCATDGVIDVDGANATLRADGPQGCPGESGTHSVGAFTAGEGCGLIQTVAPGTPGCANGVNLPACSPGAGGGNPPAPEPTDLGVRITRQRIDHRYNCYSDYTSPPTGVLWASNPLTSGQSISGCSGSPDHIYDLIEAVSENGNPIGLGTWTSWNADLGYPCNYQSSEPDVNLPAGNIRFDCATLNVKRHIRVNGNALFDGDVNVTSADGHLDIHNSLGSPGWAFLRDGTLLKDGNASLTMNYTMVYASDTSGVAMAGGTGSLVWIAPDSGDFDDLALWSDSATMHTWAGQSVLTMEGAFFTPWATSEYSGTSGQNQTKAQFIAHRLVARGQGILVIRPEVDRSITLGEATSTLVR